MLLESTRANIRHTRSGLVRDGLLTALREPKAENLDERCGMPLELLPKKIETIDPKGNRRANEQEYVLFHLRRSRAEVLGSAKLFADDALERIDRAISYIEEARKKDIR